MANALKLGKTHIEFNDENDLIRYIVPINTVHLSSQFNSHMGKPYFLCNDQSITAETHKLIREILSFN